MISSCKRDRISDALLHIYTHLRSRIFIKCQLWRVMVCSQNRILFKT
ncbi:MAG: hypothetical protein HWQ35_16445 [Nostoc sp. NMS1]|nr:MULTISPECIES: hypothetical protein [unclassified Nostoc]MBN3908081.1 hypothetical protein [Nostoc sp. NMS1]MBN3990601.1 hypothetical protein [Nostoc sp. NMS2]